MKQVHKYVSALAVSVFTLGVVSSVPAAALSEESGDGEAPTVKVEESDTTKRPLRSAQPSDANSKAMRVAQHRSGEHATTEANELREKARQLLAEERKDRKTKGLEARQKACEARQEALVKKVENYERNGAKHLAVFDKIYDRVLAYQAERQLDLSNFDELKSVVDAKKSVATEAVAAIEDLDTAIDCTSDDPAAAVATLKTTVKNAKTALHEYRVAIKDLVVALLTVKTDSSNDESSDDTSNNESTENVQ